DERLGVPTLGDRWRRNARPSSRIRVRTATVRFMLSPYLPLPPGWVPIGEFPLRGCSGERGDRPEHPAVDYFRVITKLAVESAFTSRTASFFVSRVCSPSCQIPSV